MKDIVQFQKLENIHSNILSLFASVKTKLSILLPLAEIEHIGSTSVEGSITKGDLDIGVIVQAVTFPDAKSILDSVCDRNAASHSDETYQPYIWPHENHDIGIQLFTSGSIYEKKFLYWRDALTVNTDLLGQYNELKLTYHGRSMLDYRAAKSVFIEAYLGDQD